MLKTDFYTEAHLFVAAIRILQHRNAVPPSIEDISKIMTLSLEHAGIVCRKLIDLEIIEMDVDRSVVTDIWMASGGGAAVSIEEIR